MIQGGKRNEKGKNPNFCECTNSANVLDVERSNVALECSLERSNVRVQASMGQRAEALNVRTCLMNV